MQYHKTAQLIISIELLNRQVTHTSIFMFAVCMILIRIHHIHVSIDPFFFTSFFFLYSFFFFLLPLLSPKIKIGNLPRPPATCSVFHLFHLVLSTTTTLLNVPEKSINQFFSYRIWQFGIGAQFLKPTSVGFVIK